MCVSRTSSAAQAAATASARVSDGLLITNNRRPTAARAEPPRRLMRALQLKAMAQGLWIGPEPVNRRQSLCTLDSHVHDRHAKRPPATVHPVILRVPISRDYGFRRCQGPGRDVAVQV